MSGTPRLQLSILLVLAVWPGSFLRAQVTPIVWSGAGDWSTAARWTPATVPGTGDTAQISAGTATVSDARSVGTLLFDGGSINGGGTFTLTGTNSVWTAGVFSHTGTTQVAAGAKLTLSGATGKSLNRADGFSSGGRTLENLGTITWTGAGNLAAGDGARILNQSGAIFDVQSDATLGHTGFGSTPSFTNAGTFQKSAGAGAFTIAQTAFTTSGLVAAESGTLAFTAGVTSNGGSFTASSGAGIVFTGGQSFNNGTAFSGAGSIRIEAGTTTVSGNITTQNLTFASGDLQGTASVSGHLAWTGGTWRGNATLTLTAGSSLAISGAATKSLDRADGFSSGGRTFENFGTVTWTDAGLLTASDGAHIANRASGLFLVQNDVAFAHTGFGATPTFTNQGTLRKSASTGATTFSSGTFANSGTVDVQTGTLSFPATVTSSAGTFAAASGASIVFSGGKAFNDFTRLSGASNNIRITAGDTSVAGSLTFTGVEFAGGSLHGSASIAGDLTWTGGVWRSNSVATFLTGSTLTLAGAGDKALDRADGFSSGGRIVRSSGTILWTDAGGISANDGAGIDLVTGGIFELRSDATFTHGGFGALPFLANAGTLRKTASAGTSTFSNVALTNTGRFEVLGGNVVIGGNSGGAGLGNSGIVEVQAGTLTSSAAGRTSTGGTFNVSSNAALRFTGGTNTIDGSSFNGAGLTEIAGGTLLVSGSTVSGHFKLASGAIGGGGAFTVASGGAFTWAGGSLNSTGTLAIATGGRLAIEGEADKSFYRGDGFGSGGRQITNGGSATWAGSGRILGGDGVHFNNLAGGNFDASSDTVFGYTGGGNRPSFTNAGTFRKSAGAGVTDLALNFANSGTLESRSGILRLSLGGGGAGQFLSDGGSIEFTAGYSLADGARFLGPSPTRLAGGTLEVAGTVHVGGTGAGHFALTGGTIGGGGVFTIGSSGNMQWSGGTLTSTGTLQIASGGRLDVIGSIDHNFFRGDGFGSGGRNIDNHGLIRWSEGNLRGGDGATFVNRAGAVLEITGGGSFNHTGGGNAPSFSNAGAIRKISGGDTTFSSTAVTTSGSIEVQSGHLAFASAVTSNAGSFVAAADATLTFSGGQTFNTGTTFAGAGLIRATAGGTSFNGAISADRFVFAGGTLGGTANFAGVFDWTGGALIGSATLGISSGSTLNVAGSGDRSFYRGDGFGSGGRTIENFGALIVANAGNLLGGDGAQIVNRAGGIVDFRNDQVLGYTNGGNTPSLVNQGTLRKSAGAGISTVRSTAVTHSGLVEVQSGTLKFESGVTSNAGHFSVAGGTLLEFAGGQTFNGGTTFSGGGLARVTGGTTSVAGNLALANFDFAGGNLVGTARIDSGTLRWTGGDWRGADTLTIGAGASLLVTGSGPRTLQRADGFGSGGRVLENFGSITVEHTGDLLGNDGAQWINRPGGVIQLRNDGSIAFGGGGGIPSFTNQGTLLKTAGAGTSTVAVPFTSTGAIGVLSGTLAFTSSFTHSGSSIVVQNGAGLSVPGALNLGTSSLAGTGTITAASVTAGGAVAPGNSAGTLTLTGSLTLLATSHLIFELGGTSPGSGYDVLAVGGTAALGGNLHVNFLGGFEGSVQPGDTFAILTSAGLSGAFANIASGQRLFVSGAGSFMVNYGAGSPFAASSVMLSQFVAIPEPSTYALLGFGVLVVLGALRRRR